MKTLLIFIICANLQCVLFRKEEPRLEEISKREYVIPDCKLKFWSKSKFYIYDPSEVIKSKIRSISYLGSDDNFHFFYNWEKFYESNEVRSFAIRIDKCKVINPRKIDEEYNFVEKAGGWRRPIIDSCGCNVPIERKN